MSSKAPPTTTIATPAQPSSVAKTRPQPKRNQNATRTQPEPNQNPNRSQAEPNQNPTRPQPESNNQTTSNTQSRRALLKKDTQVDEYQVLISKEFISEFKIGDTIKIEGPSQTDRPEYRTISGIAPTGVLMVDAPLELKHRRGATVRVARLAQGRKKNNKIQARLLDSVLPEGETQTNGNFEIRIEKDRINDFSIGDCVKIEGPSGVDPCEFRTITGTSPTGGISLDEALECKHEEGAIVKLLLSQKDEQSQESIRKVVKAELDNVLKKKLKDKDGNYGIRFFPGETRTSLEVMLAVTIDIAQLLKKFPSAHVKIIGYSGAPSSDGDYKTREDVKYLALKRCQVIKELLQGKGVTNPIGIESGISLNIFACCLIEFVGPDKEQDIQEINEAGLKLISEKESEKELLDTSVRFEINATSQVGGRFLARIDLDMCAMNGKRFKQDNSRENTIDGATRVALKSSKENALLRNENHDANTSQVYDYSAVLSTIEETTGLNQPYLPNEEVEYFSRTNSCWMHALVTKVIFDEHIEDQWLYELLFRSGKVRTLVDMGSLRKPLGQDGVKTKVEVYTKRNNGTWLPGYIEGYQASASSVGYQVMMALEPGTPEQLLKNVPSERIRRRFEAGTEIEFYVDSKFGWRRATVSAEAKDGCSTQGRRGVKEFEWRHPELSKHLQVALSTPVHWRTDDEQTESKPTEPSVEKPESTTDVELSLEPWTLVPIEIEESVAAEIFQHMQKVGYKNYELQTSLEVELFRVRSLSVVADAKPDSIFRSLVVSL